MVAWQENFLRSHAQNAESGFLEKKTLRELFCRPVSSTFFLRTGLFFFNGIVVRPQFCGRFALFVVIFLFLFILLLAAAGVLQDFRREVPD